MTDDDFVGDHDRLTVAQIDGRWWTVIPGYFGSDEEPVAPIRAYRYRLTGDLFAVRIICGATEAEQARGIGQVLNFVVDDGECERVGMPVEVL